MGKDSSIIQLKAHVDKSEIEEAVKTAEHLGELLKEARSLADELASREINIPVNIIEG